MNNTAVPTVGYKYCFNGIILQDHQMDNTIEHSEQT